MISVAKIRLDPPKSTRLFKGIICDDISEFESHMPSHAVRSRPAKMRAPHWDGTLERIHHALYVAVREQEGRVTLTSSAFRKSYPGRNGPSALVHKPPTGAFTSGLLTGRSPFRSVDG